MKAIGTLLAFLILSLNASPAIAGAWTKPQGDGELILNHFYYTSDQFFDRNGNTSAQPRFDKYEINPYVEYGYTDTLTIGANLFVHYLEQDIINNSTDANFGLGDSEFFARYQLYHSHPFTLSVQPLVKLPSLYATEDAPRSGSDTFDAELGLLGGYAFRWFGRSHYLDSKLAYRHRFDNELADQVLIDLKLGLKLSDGWQFIPAIVTTWSVDEVNDPVFTEDGQNDYDLIKLEAVLQYQLAPERYIQLGGFGHVDGKNVGDGYGLIVSYGLSF